MRCFQFTVQYGNTILACKSCKVAIAIYNDDITAILKMFSDILKEQNNIQYPELIKD